MKICADFTASMQICYPQPMKHLAGMVAGSATTRVLISYECFVEITRICGLC